MGGYDDWQHQLAARNSLVEKKPSAKLAKTGKKNKKKRKADDKSDKLSFKEQQELDKLPGSIEKLEASIEALTQTMADPEFYQSSQRQNRHHPTRDEHHERGPEKPLTLAGKNWKPAWLS